MPDIPLHPASATKMSCSSSKAAGCSLHAPHFIIFLAQAAHPTPGWDFFLHPLAEPAPPTLIPAGSSSSGKSWSFPSRSLGSAVLLPVLYLLLWCPIQAISPHLFHSICSSVLSPEISAPADVLCTLKNIQPPVKLFIPPRFCALGAACRPPGELTRAINQRDI